MDLGSLLHWLALFLVVTPVVVHLHELGHAAAALRLTTDSVVIQGCIAPFGAARLGRLNIALGFPALWGVCYHADAPSRHGNAAIAAAGPLASLLVGSAAAGAWCMSYGGDLLAAFSLVNLFMGVANLIPVEVAPSRGAFAANDSDGRVILRSFGAATLRPTDAPMISLPFAVVLLIIASYAAYHSIPAFLLICAGFGYAWWETRRVRRASDPPRGAARAGDTSRSVPPPGPR